MQQFRISLVIFAKHAAIHLTLLSAVIRSVDTYGMLKIIHVLWPIAGMKHINYLFENQIHNYLYGINGNV